MSNSSKKFTISQTVRHISTKLKLKLLQRENHFFTVKEERFNILWFFKLVRKNGNLGLFLYCGKKGRRDEEWTVETEFTLKLKQRNGPVLEKDIYHTFDHLAGYGCPNILSWKDFEKYYIFDDSIIVEADVTILKTTGLESVKRTSKAVAQSINEDSGSSRKVTRNPRTFVLNHTVNNVSNISEGTDYISNTEIRHNIPWQLKIQRKKGDFVLLLRCDETSSKSWEIEVEFELTLKSVNGRNFSKTMHYTFTKRCSYGKALMSWDDMKKRYAVNDSIIIEVSGKIIRMTGCDYEIDDLNGDLSNCFINVGGQKYALKKL